MMGAQAALPSAANQVSLVATIASCDVLRHTPAGIAAIDLTVAHQSEVLENEQCRQVTFTLPCVALGTPALLLKDAALGTPLRLYGFLASKSVRSGALRLHITDIEFLSR